MFKLRTRFVNVIKQKTNQKSMHEYELQTVLRLGTISIVVSTVEIKELRLFSLKLNKQRLAVFRAYRYRT